MKLILAFFRLARWPNLFFIALTQFLFYYCIILPSFRKNPSLLPELKLKPDLFLLLCASSVLIAAAGYIINDYFDLNIDSINKPGKLVVEKYIKRRWTIIWHWILSALGVLLGFYVSWKIDNFLIGLANMVCVLILWFYSTTFKKKLLIGNVLISLLTAWVVMVLWVAEFKVYTEGHAYFQRLLSRLFKFSVLYSGFAFIISLVREVVKDIEDMAGDYKYGCRTMPIAWGVQVSKVFAGTWLAVLLASLVIINVYILQYGWWLCVLYAVALVLLPLLLVLRDLYRARSTADFHLLSNQVKGIMLTGILSIIFFKFYMTWSV